MIVVALGANLDSSAGPPRETLLAALDMLEEKNVRICALSPFYRTPAWPDASDPRYVNAVATVATELAPGALMTLLEGVETHFGRKRSTKNAPRTLDLDLILYGDAVISLPAIVVPHPRFRERRFVLEPLAEIAPSMVDPVSGLTIRELLSRI